MKSWAPRTGRREGSCGHYRLQPKGSLGVAVCTERAGGQPDSNPVGQESLYEPTTSVENDSQTPYEEPEYVVQTPVTSSYGITTTIPRPIG